MNKGFILPKTWYYIISFTWGFALTLIGCIITGVLMLMGHKPQKNIYGWYIEFGKGWGGFSAGPCSIVSKDSSEHILQHEFGHSIQNCIFGPLTIFYTVIPSVLRYWYREIKQVYSPDYDYAWFEGQATMFGERYFNALKEEAL